MCRHQGVSRQKQTATSNVSRTSEETSVSLSPNLVVQVDLDADGLLKKLFHDIALANVHQASESAWEEAVAASNGCAG